jgi:hypothetical protein
MTRPVSALKKALRDKFVYECSPTAIRKNPDLCVALASVVNASAILDVQLGWALAKLLGTGAEAGSAMYLALTSASAQKAALLAAANAVLDAEDLALFNVLMELVRKVKDRRNTIVHGTWGWSAQIPDALILIPGRDAIKEAIGFAQAHSAPEWPDSVGGVTLDQIIIYNKKDFWTLVADLDRVSHYIGRFWFPSFRTDSTTADERKLLANVPEIQTVLLRLNRAQSASVSSKQTSRKSRVRT